MIKPVKPELPTEEPKKRLSVNEFSHEVTDSLYVEKGKTLIDSVLKDRNFLSLYPNPILSGDWKLVSIQISSDGDYDRPSTEVYLQFSGGILEYNDRFYDSYMVIYKNRVASYKCDLAKYHEDMEKYKEWEAGAETRELEEIKKDIEKLEKRKRKLEKSGS